MENIPHYTKTNLVDKVAKELALPASKATAVTDCVIGNLKKLIIAGDVTLTGFMSVKHRVKHMPKVVLNGVEYPARIKRTLKFSAGKDIKEAIKSQE